MEEEGALPAMWLTYNKFRKMMHFEADEVEDLDVAFDSDDSEDIEAQGMAPDGDAGEREEADTDVDVDIEDLDAEELKIEESDLNSVKDRIESICGILSKWSAVTKAQTVTRKRESFVSELKRLVSLYYGYSDELADYFLKLFNPVEAIQFFEANEQPLPLTIRTNTLKTRRKELAVSLINRGANVDPTGDWTKEGLVVHSSKVPIGATPEYLAGHYMLQSASSLIPVLALAPKEGEKVLDIAAAPGGKTTHIGQIMNNTGLIYANDFNKDRCKALVANIHRLGVTNTIVTNYDGTKLLNVLPPLDRVLCDAPCSGLGVISRDPSVKVKRTLKDIQENAVLQKQLLCTAIDLVNSASKTGGCIVYSTCSLSVEENEEVVNYALRMRNVKLVPLGLDIGSPAFSRFRGRKFHPSIAAHARRFYPHKHNLDGFFVAKFVKLSNKIPIREKRFRGFPQGQNEPQEAVEEPKPETFEKPKDKKPKGNKKAKK
ncbi:NOL1/NOP2/sun RNA methylase family member protein [Theileria equi strain WA]|uniref:NOL1/NOP2/sun RNA methylase family member protein n=1 Tax=Theileria equi strain WA TaxID=1537102 RepID=L0AVD5_THEEQ|nr:NOL1/NOP2/sun RNA methylase family member protein [Theileria equi strain WA]AFZ79505.1 NOL1/NOP2/sun RNA methylase family member protein [Theileria equi strain WA]|eukprot:XP_004829171.1 NOL1/NOP2/sun RNA methylase family member protein [Theileria equi strain WA]